MAVLARPGRTLLLREQNAIGVIDPASGHFPSMAGDERTERSPRLAALFFLGHLPDQRVTCITPSSRDGPYPDLWSLGVTTFALGPFFP